MEGEHSPESRFGLGSRVLPANETWVCQAWGLGLPYRGCFVSSKTKAAVGVPLLEPGVRGGPGGGGGGWWHVLAGFLSQLWLGGTSGRTWSAGPGLLRGGWPGARSWTCLASLACGASGAWGFLGRALALLPTRCGSRRLWWSRTGDRCLTGSLWRACLALRRRGGRWAGCRRRPRASCHWPGLAALTLGHRCGLGCRLLGR
jgi:hypothetical protein